MARQVVLIPYFSWLADTINFRKDYSPLFSSPSQPYTHDGAPSRSVVVIAVASSETTAARSRDPALHLEELRWLRVSALDIWRARTRREADGDGRREQRI